MMSRAVLDADFRQVVEKTAEKVHKLGFRRQGSILRIVGECNAGIIEFQKSTSNTSSKILFTVNLAVVCGALLEPYQHSLGKARSMGAHLRERIGTLMPGGADKWWEISEGVAAGALASEVSEVIATEGAPYVARYLELNELIALWESGKSPGLTETQRVRYLKKLKSQSKI
jgi:hypothetical protein